MRAADHRSSLLAGIAVATGSPASRAGIFGGLFLTRAQALKYALAENNHHPEAIVEISIEMDLDIPGERTEAVSYAPPIGRDSRLSSQ